MTSRGVSTGVHARRTDAVTKRHEAADLIIGYLEQLGVEYVFGVPGGAIRLQGKARRFNRRLRIAQFTLQDGQVPQR